MTIKKLVITKGTYLDRELRLLVSLDENDNALDVFNIDITKVGIKCKATVEKVLNDVDACIVKFDTGDKGFIENKKLKPDHFLVRHSQKKFVCQGDEFYVQISQDRTNSKPYSCNFLGETLEDENNDFIHYFVDKYCEKNVEIVSDLDEIINSDLPVRAYYDDSVSLWQLYNLTKILDVTISMITHLPKGGNLFTEPTEALTVIDVNSGKNYGKTSLMDTNRIAAKEIARQLRLKKLSGIIIVDFLKVSKAEEKELCDILKEACKADYAIVTIHGFTNLGLMEITRSRSFSKCLFEVNAD